MADSAQTLENMIANLGYPTLDDRGILLCLAGLYGTNAGLTGQQAITGAIAQGYEKLDDRQLDQCLLVVLAP
jgi:hypothetical protein